MSKSHCHTLIEEQLSQYPQETRDKWETFVGGKLAEINERNTIIPPSSYEDGKDESSSYDEDAGFKDITFPQESSTAQVRIIEFIH